MDIQSCKKALEELNSKNRESLREYEMLLAQKQLLEAQKTEKIANLENIKNELHFKEINEANLSERNEEMRKVLSEIDLQLKLENSKISEETKSFFQIINLKVTIQKNKSNENYLQVKLDFLEKANSFVTFFYDPTTNDYDLTDTSPEVPNFNEIKSLLRTTGDLQGFLSNFRKFIKKTG